jgi:hypothetical protein
MREARSLGVLITSLASLTVSLYFLIQWMEPWTFGSPFPYNFMNLDNVQDVATNPRLLTVRNAPLLLFGLAHTLVPILSLVTTLSSVAILTALGLAPAFRYFRAATICVSILVLWQCFVLLMFHLA